jgi:colicin import membrane protein
MNATATIARPYAVPESSGNGRAIVLAVLVHALLGALLFFGIRWQSSPPAVIQAELWSATPQTAAPPPQPIPPPPKVEAPAPEPKPDPEPPVPKADIVERAPPKVEPKKKEPVKVEAPKPQPKPVAPPAPPKVEAKPQPAKPLPPPKEAPARPPSDLAAIMASANGTPTSTGKDQQTSGPRGRDSYIARLVTAIRSQMRYPASASGNPYATMRIEQLPNGEVVNVTVTRPSGVPAFDEAIERAIRAASPLPRDEQGKVERQLTLDYYMYEKN